jgi:hypothetical protein
MPILHKGLAVGETVSLWFPSAELLVRSPRTSQQIHGGRVDTGAGILARP